MTTETVFYLQNSCFLARSVATRRRGKPKMILKKSSFWIKRSPLQLKVMTIDEAKIAQMAKITLNDGTWSYLGDLPKIFPAIFFPYSTRIWSSCGTERCLVKQLKNRYTCCSLHIIGDGASIVHTRPPCIFFQHSVRCPRGAIAEARSCEPEPADQSRADHVGTRATSRTERTTPGCHHRRHRYDSELVSFYEVVYCWLGTMRTAFRSDGAAGFRPFYRPAVGVWGRLMVMRYRSVEGDETRW